MLKTVGNTGRTGSRLSAQALTGTILVGLMLGLGIYICWTFNRGLELSDEAYYLLNARYPEAVRFYVTAFKWLVAPLWYFTGSLASFRASGFVILTLSAMGLALGVLRAAHWFGIEPDASRWMRLQAIASCVIAAWLYGATLNFSPSYNLLSAAGIYLTVGLTLAGLDCRDRRLSLLNTLAIGVILGLTALAKFSTGICGALLVTGIHVVLWRAPGSRWIDVVAMWLAIPATIVLVAACFETPTHAWAAFREGLAIASIVQPKMSIAAQLMQNAEQLYAMLEAALIAFWPALVWAVLAVLLRRPSIGVVAAGVAAVIVVRDGLAVGGLDRYATQSMPLAGIVVLAIVATIRVWGGRLMTMLLVAALFFLPFLIALGTANQVSFQIVLSLAPWGLLCAALGQMARDTQRWVPMAFSLVLAATIVSQVITSGMRIPYRLISPLAEQTNPVDIPGLGHVLVDSETLKFVEAVRGAAMECHIAPGTPYQGLYNLAGVALVLDTVPLDTPWLFSKPFAQAVLQGSDPAELKRAVLGVTLARNGARLEMPAVLSTFPQGYRKCGTAVLPFLRDSFEIWAPVNR
ncbi:hypothetical protein PCO31111_01198 [Pandoraea communis]|uniref:Glycosyltransferase RgtA/B/C/D-like domain-containing protein n=1 Tax=Pandoraea communis TaxID=2508297 RepID=A0A5E4T8C3_9BURK|nr:hypothetical protein [Pandoraea communis]VVD82684.1 hypothetical protein PCO31111_01198 [Pandoraea communis]